VAQVLLSAISFLKGDMHALDTAEGALHQILETGSKTYYVQGCTAFAATLSIMAGIIPDAKQKAKDYYEKAIAVAREIGARGFLGQDYLGLGQLCSAEGDKDKARQYLTKAITLFEQCELEADLKQAKEALESLKQ
jgi:tetratricopeptide (TPR) repeat protein